MCLCFCIFTGLRILQVEYHPPSLTCAHFCPFNYSHIFLCYLNIMCTLILLHCCAHIYLLLAFQNDLWNIFLMKLTCVCLILLHIYIDIILLIWIEIFSLITNHYPVMKLIYWNYWLIRARYHQSHAILKMHLFYSFACL